MDPQLPVSQKKNSQKLALESVNLPLLLSLEQKQETTRYIAQFIKPISFKHKPEFEALLADAVANKYYRRKVGEEALEGEKNLDAATVKILIKDIERMNTAFKECQLSSPIADCFNMKFFHLLAEAVGEGLISNLDVLWLWEIVPFKILRVFLQTLNLDQHYINQDPQKFAKTLLSLINDGKLLQACCYYNLYSLLPQFEQDLLIPKLLSTDQIYNPIIIELFRNKEELKRKVISQIDPAKAVIILEHLEEDPRLYERVHQFILRKHYKSMVHQYSEWYIFEDKMSFNPKFIQWYCHEREDLPQTLRQSIKLRNGIPSTLDQEVVPNPLYELDHFSNAEAILEKARRQETKGGQDKQTEQNEGKYLNLLQYGIKEEDVHFISSSSCSEFDQMVKIISMCTEIGFDAEYRCTSTKYQQLGVALIQMAAQNQIYLIDFIALETHPKFLSFFTSLLSNPHLLIVGHSVQSDIKFIQRTMKVQSLEGVVDISKIFKEKFPNETQTSLAFMTSFMTGKQLSKYEQRSNWNRRPLKKTQAHYAALDAQICLALFEMLKTQQVRMTQAVAKNKKITIDNLVRRENIVYQKAHQGMLNTDRPKFLIDNMLKRLCSLLRNLGIDAEYMGVCNYELMQETAKKEGRIILTKDKKLLSKKSAAMPIYCIAQKGDSDLMLEEVRRQFNLNLSLFKPLSRCVKCNCPDLEVIQPEEALKYLNFQYEDSTVKQFWRCQKCRQIYWEGNQFKNAKKKFGGMSEMQEV